MIVYTCDCAILNIMIYTCDLCDSEHHDLHSAICAIILNIMTYTVRFVRF